MPVLQRAEVPVPAVTVLGGYGVFGGKIAQALASERRCSVRVVGRDARAGASFARRIGAEFVRADIACAAQLRGAIAGSHVVVHAAGPFQGRDYRVALLCLDQGSHYIDIADARSFVTGITALDGAARARGLCVTSGASTVPALSYALVQELAPALSTIDQIEIALAPGNQNPRGPATVAAILSYLGRPIEVWQQGRWTRRPGWGDARWVDFPPPVGSRCVHTCDVPDLELFPTAWGARTVRFAAGLELGILNGTLRALARLRRYWRLELLGRAAPAFVWFAGLLAPWGSPYGALAVCVRGTQPDGTRSERRLAIVSGRDAPAVAAAPAVVLARKILAAGPPRNGAFPCVNLMSLQELLDELEPAGARPVRGDAAGWEPISVLGAG